MTRLRKVLIAGLAMAGVLAAASHVLTAKPAQTRTFTRADPKGEVSIGATVRGSGPLVVLVPSLGRGGADFDDLATRLAQAGFTAASLDPRGVGQSRGPMEGLTLFDYAEDAAMVARGLSTSPAVFIGHAYGNAPGASPDGPRGMATPHTLFNLYSASKAITAMVDWLRSSDAGGDPGRIHHEGQVARAAVETAREQVAMSSTSMSRAETNSSSLSLSCWLRAMSPIEWSVIPPILRVRSAMSSVILKI